MIYSIKFTIPANTSKTNPKKQVVELKKGVIHRIIISIPRGHGGVTGLRIMYGNLQLWPEEPDTWFSGDGEILDFVEYFELPSDPTKLTLEGYNESVSYDHSFHIRIGILPKLIAAPWFIIARFVRILSRLIGI